MTNNTVDQEFIAEAITAERLSLCALLEDLDVDDWREQSLCEQWTIHDVVAHLSLATRETLRGMIVGMIKARGDWERMNAEQAIAHARNCPPLQLVQQLRDSAGSSRRAPMSNPVDPLIDILVHGQDIARPLRREHAMDPERVKPALTYAVESRWYEGKKRFAGLRLAPTDDDWTIGSGEEIFGTAGDLLLVAVGRPVGLEDLSGPGVDILEQRLALA